MSYERLPIDTRLVEEIARSPRMRREQGPDWLGRWGGPSRYQEVAKLPYEARVVHYAYLDGFTDPDLLEIETGLSPAVIKDSLALLRRKGLID